MQTHSNDAPAVYRWTGPTGVDFTQVRSPAGTYYHQETPQIVRDLLDGYRSTGQRVRVFIGDRVTGKCWGNEFETIGTIGRSMGRIAIPLLIKTARSTGGGALLDSCIVGIQTAPGVWSYRHPSLTLGDYTVGAAVTPGYGAGGYRDGKMEAQFKRAGQAERWVAFMLGNRWAK